MPNFEGQESDDPYELPPDPYYGDAPYAVDEMRGPDYTAADQSRSPAPEGALPTPYYNPEVARRETDIAQPGVVHGTQQSVYIDGELKHIVYHEVRTPDGSVPDSVTLGRHTLEALRFHGDYTGEVRPTPSEQGIIVRYGDALVEMCMDLELNPARIRQKAQDTPYHIFPKKELADAAVTNMLSRRYVRPNGGSYSPFTGVIWARTTDPHEQECGLAQMVACSAAAVTLFPKKQLRQLGASERRAIGGRPLPTRSTERSRAQPDSQGARDSYKDQNEGTHLVAGFGYLREDLRTRNGGWGFNAAVTNLATARLLRTAAYQGKPLLSGGRLNVILHGLIEGVAERTKQPPRLIADGLLRGYYNGRLDGFNTVCAALGPEGTRCMLQLTGDETTDDVMRLSRQLRIPQIGDLHDRLRKGYSVQIYGW